MNVRDALLAASGLLGGNSGGGLTVDDMVDHTKPAGEVTVALAITANTGAYRHGLDYRTGITGLNLPNATAVPNHFCNYCTNLETVNAPEALFLGESAFSHTKIRYGVFPKLKALINYAMSDNAALEAVDFLGGAYSGDYSGLSRSGVFNNCSSLATLVIRSTARVYLYAINVFTGTPFASGKSGGTVYVPAALVDSYRSATNWSTIFGYGGGEQNAILPIEGSVYETQYVDGTPIPAT